MVLCLFVSAANEVILAKKRNKGIIHLIVSIFERVTWRK